MIYPKGVQDVSDNVRKIDFHAGNKYGHYLSFCGRVDKQTGDRDIRAAAKSELREIFNIQ